MADQPAVKVAPGSTWSLTFGSGTGPCETQFFAHGTWSADKNGDAGTYVVNGKSLTEKWTSGDQVGLKFVATYVKARGIYKGTFSGFQTGPGELRKGHKPTC